MDKSRSISTSTYSLKPRRNIKLFSVWLFTYSIAVLHWLNSKFCTSITISFELLFELFFCITGNFEMILGTSSSNLIGKD